MTKEVDWLPQDRQLVLLKACGLSYPFTDVPFHPALADVIGYGGSAGGGKTDGMLMIALIAALTFSGINIGYFRRNFPQLEGPGGAMLRSRYLFEGLGRLADKRWTMTTKSIVQFCHCSNATDVFNYQSQQFDIMLFDESTQFTKDMIDYLLTRNRKTIGDDRFKPFAVMATNPGGVGHGVFKERFVQLPSIEEPHDYRYDSGIVLKHVFIPSKLSDNQILVQRDPGYANRIGTNELNRKMLLDGDWDVFAGQAYSELSRDVHLIDPFEIESHWNRIAAYDHGFNHPFSYAEAAVDDDGNVYLYKHVSKRLLRPDEIVPLIKSDGYKLQYIHAGHDLWSRQRDGGKTVAESFQTMGIFMQRANIDRVQGVQQVRDYLSWKNKLEVNGQKVDGKPRFYIFKNCQEVYNNLAERIFDPNHPEDVLKADADSEGNGGDDPSDCVRYLLMSRPRIRLQVKPRSSINSGQYLLDQIEQERRKRLSINSFYNMR